MKQVGFAAVLVAVGSMSVSATEMVAAGDYVIEASEATTIGEPLSVPSDAAVTNYPWYCPTGNFVAFKNVDVTNIEEMTVLWAHRSGLGNNQWRQITSWRKTEVSSTSANYDFQHLEGSLYGGYIKLTQSGSDVVANIQPRWSWGTSRPACEHTWNETGYAGSGMNITNNEIYTIDGYGGVYRPTAWRNLSCTLKTAKKSVPERIVFKNTRPTDPPIAKDNVSLLREGSFTNTTFVSVWKGARLSWIKDGTLTAKLGGTDMGSKWKQVQMVVGTADATEGTNVIFEIGSSPLYGVKINFKQVGDDVHAKAVWARWVYGKYLGYDFNGSNKGAGRTFSGTVDGAQLAIADFAAEESVPGTYERMDVCPDWIMQPEQIAFRGVDPADILSVSALMAGSEMYGRDNATTVYHETNRTDGAVDRQFQAKPGNYVYNVSVRLEQQGADIRATPHRIRYDGTKPLGTDFETTGTERKLTNTMSDAHVSLHQLTIARTWKSPLPITVGSFDAYGLPVLLKNVDLKLSPAAAETISLSGGVAGLGSVVKEGAGTVVLSSDVRTTGGLQALGGVLEVSGDRLVATEKTWEAPEPVKVGADGTLRFVLDANGVSSLDVTSLGVEQGATIALRATEDPGFGKERTMLTLVSGANLTAADLAKLTLAVDSPLLDKYSFRLWAADNGDLVLWAWERQGCVLLVR